MSDKGSTKYFVDLGNANWRACYKNAKKYGFSKEQADLCEDGKLCPKCIFDKED